MAIEIVDFPMKNGDFPWQHVISPEGIRQHDGVSAKIHGRHGSSESERRRQFIDFLHLGLSENRLKPEKANGFADHYPVLKNIAISLGVFAPYLKRHTHFIMEDLDNTPTTPSYFFGPPLSVYRGLLESSSPCPTG